MSKFYHATATEKLASIRENGLNAGCYLTNNLNMAEYYAETVADEDLTPVIIEIDGDALDTSAIKPDRPGIEEPIMSVVRDMHQLNRYASEEWVANQWSKSKKDWKASLDIIGCVRYAAVIPVRALTFETVDDLGSEPAQAPRR